jgi:Putative zinc-finger
MMNDCQNAEIRDQLPDLLHDRLTAGERAAVLAHVDDCAECRDELELLRGVQEVLIANAPRVNTLNILSALPKPGQSAAVPMIQARPSRSRWADWRIAAAITVMAVGGGSFALLSRSHASVPETPVASVPVTPKADTQVAPAPRTEVTPTREVVAQTNPVADVRDVEPVDEDTPENATEGGRLNNLSAQQVKALLNDIGQMKAVPIAEPDPITIKVDSKASSNTSGDTEML